MRRAVAGSILTLCLAVLSAGPAFTQDPSPEVTSDAISPTAARVSYVYVGTANGVYLYNAAANGTLTKVSGSPFKIAGTVAGSNRKYFISLDTDNLYTYLLASNGAIEQQKSLVNTISYSNKCETTTSAVYDHTGQQVYVELMGPLLVDFGEICAAVESFNVSSASGSLTFTGSTFVGGEYYTPAGPLSITGNDAYAYNVDPIGGTCRYKADTFHRGTSGALDAISFNETDPTPQPGWFYIPVTLAADPTNHLAAAVAMTMGGSCGPVQAVQLASYTVDTQGDVTSTNTWQNIPAPAVYPRILGMSPSGKLLAVAGNMNGFAPIGVPVGTNGLQIFHFNGADPITPYSKTLTTTPIDQIHWDNNNHLYALSDSAKKLYVYTVTPTTIAEAPGSPYTIASSPNGLVVVPILCSAPTSPGVHICAPASSSTSSSPVLVEAAATVTGTISNMQLWVDGVKKYTASGSKTLNTSVSVAAGTHRFAVFAINTAGQKWESAVNATVK